MQDPNRGVWQFPNQSHHRGPGGRTLGQSGQNRPVLSRSQREHRHESLCNKVLSVSLSPTNRTPTAEIFRGGYWLCMIFYLNPRRRSDTAASPALTCVGSPGSPPEVAASDASDLIPGYKPPFLERTLVCIEPQNLEDDDHDDVYYTISARDSNVDDDVR